VTEGQMLAAIDASSYEQTLDQAVSDLQEAEAYLEDLTTPPTDLQIAEADLAVAQAQLRVEQARDELENLRDPDTDGLESALVNAQDSLAQAELDLALQKLDTLYGSERDLLYAIDWHDRRANELELLISDGRANLEEVEELTEQRDSLAEANADLASVRSQQELEMSVAEAEYAAAAAAVADAADALAEATAGPDALDVARAKLSIDEAEVALAEAREKRIELDEGVDSVDLAAAQASLEKKRLAVLEAEEALVAATMVAPFDGTILQTQKDEGDLITGSSKILTIANLGNLQVQAAVDETSVRQISSGQQASITFDAFPGQFFSGKVLSVPLQGSLQGDVMVYQIPVSLVGAEELPLLVGMTANVDIEVGQVENGLLVPTIAVQNIGGFYQVLVPSSISEAGPEAVPVEIGLSDGVYTHIVRGLNDGDQVVVQLQASDSFQFGFGGMGGMGMGPPGVVGGGRR
jgi:HlyD family secretion protein